MAVIETGLGGRLDATNVLAPVLTIITDISMDHAEILGNSLGLIAGEKAGIVKAGVPNLIGPLPAEATAVIRKVCRERGAPLVSMSGNGVRIDKRHLCLDFHDDGLNLSGFAPSLPGVHQLRNCALALKAMAVLRRQGFAISGKAVTTGLHRVEWPGRFQMLKRPNKPRMILDVCHNPGGAAAFADTFARTFPRRKCSFVVGFVKRKDHQRIIDVLAPLAERFELVPLKTGRTVDIKELQQTLNWHGVPVFRAGRLETALARLLKTAGSDDIISVVGSHYLVGEFLKKNALR